MRINRAFLPLVLSGLSLFAQESAAPNRTTRYFVVFLRPAPARKPLEKADGERIQAAHMANIRSMADEGSLISAGPFDDSPATISGIFVFQIGSLQAAQALAAQDPTVIEHRNTFDVHAWDGPPGVGEQYYEEHLLDPDAPVNMQIHPFCMLYRGADWDRKENKRDALLLAHERYIERLRAMGKLGAAGAIDDRDELLGLVIFRTIAFDEAQRLLEKDPAVEAGVLRAEYHRWWSADHVLPWRSTLKPGWSSREPPCRSGRRSWRRSPSGIRRSGIDA